MSNLQLKFLEQGGRDIGNAQAATLQAAMADMQSVCRIMEELAVSPDSKRAYGKRGTASETGHQPKQGRYGISLDFDPSIESEGMLEALSLFLSSVKKGNLNDFIQKFENESKALEILAKLSDVASLCTEEKKIVLQSRDGTEFDFFQNRMNLSQAKTLVTESSQEDQDLEDQDLEDRIIAKLAFVDQDNHVLHFEHSLAKKPLTFNYGLSDALPQDNISKIASCKSGFLELHGDIRLNEDGSPCELVDLKKIKQVNLDKIVVREVKTDNGAITPHEPLAFHPQLSELGTLYIVDVKPFGGELYEQTRDFLIAEIHDYLSFLWDFYAMEENHKLDAKAQELKKAALRAFKLKGE